jgi:hypothetical protein
MAIAGFSVMNPISTMSMIDTTRWRPVIYADTPVSLAHYQRFVKEEKKGDGRKAVLFCFGAAHLQKVLKDRAKFSSVLVFDDLQNLHALATQLDSFSVVDVHRDENNCDFPKHLTPVDLMEVIERPGTLPDPFPLLSKITNALSRKRPSVLETTSRLPTPDGFMESGVHKLLSDLKALLPDDSKISFAVLLDVYVKFLFKIVDRNHVTTAVTKKLPAGHAKELWNQALEFATSAIGETMAKAYYALCTSVDADYRVGHAVADHGLRSYSGDFVYFTSVLPPHRKCQFLPGAFDESAKPSLPLVKVYKPVAEAPTPKKRGQKKARNR